MCIPTVHDRPLHPTMSWSIMKVSLGQGPSDCLTFSQLVPGRPGGSESAFPGHRVRRLRG
ncbi:hypothetical protein BD311DRAFT_769551 [Dichomitus squalens]|uniref:Uncharacterized protein n=1 Tax=Dichomitus squalens TaxID=114155 RepID=A0A4V6MVS4_9APHY|nr:hypothetical protein BD311DRAFT_769551 [Dichomitus squalens]